jgi:putative pyruvate formate lyase activating enzyme
MRKEPANQQYIYKDDEIALLSECIICPWECRINRFEGEKGYCGIGAGFDIASVCIHKGEEPLINGNEGICNIFFSGCNMRCIFCQNHQISQPTSDFENTPSNLEEILDKIELILCANINSVGFVSPSHVVPQVKAIIRGLKSRNLNPVTVYNTNSYDKKSIIKSLDGLIDIYLPDYKYVTPKLAKDFSEASNYPEIALKAIKEMYFQKGSVVQVNDEGMAESGLIIRHLVLPGHAEESKMVLRSIAEEISTGVHISLMSQYRPTSFIENHPQLGRAIYKTEYESVVEEMEKLGFRNGWVQEMNSSHSYNPDFRKDHPFE